jgi:hypothetical protein
MYLYPPPSDTELRLINFTLTDDSRERHATALTFLVLYWLTTPIFISLLVAQFFDTGTRGRILPVYGSYKVPDAGCVAWLILPILYHLICIFQGQEGCVTGRSEGIGDIQN